MPFFWHIICHAACWYDLLPLFLYKLHNIMPNKELCMNYPAPHKDRNTTPLKEGQP